MKEIVIGNPQIGHLNRGLFFGENFFTSFCSYGGSALFLQSHLNRIKTGFDVFYPKVDIKRSLKELEEIILKEVRLNENHYFRVTPIVSLDKKEFGIHILKKSIENRKLERRSLTWVEDCWDQNNFPEDLKLGNYAKPFYLYRNLPDGQHHDILKIDKDQNIIESTTSNIFFLKADKLIFPKLKKSGLNGVVARHIQKINEENSEIRDIHIDELLTMDSAFLTNSVQLFTLVDEINGHSYKVNPSFLEKDFLLRNFLGVDTK